MLAREHHGDCGSHFQSLPFTFSHLMRPVGKKEYSARILFITFPKRKDLEVEHKGLSNIFLCRI